MSDAQLTSLLTWSVWIGEIARYGFYVVGLLLMIAVVAWVFYGGSQERWPIGDAITFVFCVAFLAAMAGVFVILYKYKR